MGVQKDNFLKLFTTLQRELIKWQSHSSTPYILLNEDKTNTEIVTQKEINLLYPFEHRLLSFDKRSMQVVCIEDIPVVDYDDFLYHFVNNKILPHQEGDTYIELVPS